MRRPRQVNSLAYWYVFLWKVPCKYLIFTADSVYGTLIKTELIPAIAYLRSTYPLRVDLFFPSAFLEIFCVNPDLDFTNLTTTDLFFDSIYLYKLIFPPFFHFR